MQNIKINAGIKYLKIKTSIMGSNRFNVQNLEYKNLVPGCHHIVFVFINHDIPVPTICTSACDIGRGGCGSFSLLEEAWMLLLLLLPLSSGSILFWQWNSITCWLSNNLIFSRVDYPSVAPAPHVHTHCRGQHWGCKTIFLNLGFRRKQKRCCGLFDPRTAEFLHFRANCQVGNRELKKFRNSRAFCFRSFHFLNALIFIL